MARPAGMAKDLAQLIQLHTRASQARVQLSERRGIGIVIATRFCFWGVDTSVGRCRQLEVSRTPERSCEPNDGFEGRMQSPVEKVTALQAETAVVVPVLNRAQHGGVCNLHGRETRQSS